MLMFKLLLQKQQNSKKKQKLLRLSEVREKKKMIKRLF